MKRYVALTPRQRELRDEYLLDEALDAAGIPDWNALWERVRDDPLMKREVREDVEAEFRALAEHEFHKLVDLYHRWDGRDIWRAMALPSDVEPVDQDRLGIYWSLERSGAAVYQLSRAPRTGTWDVVVYRAELDIDYLDWPETLLARFDPDYGHEEAEARFVPRAPLWVYDVEVIEPVAWRRQEGGITYEIDDWRRA